MKEEINYPSKLNRFTTIPFLIDILTTKRITLLNPKTWEDHNDLDILLEYKNKKSIKGLVALCFTHESETIHHWKAFSNNENGCCIEFDGSKLLEILSKDEKINHDKVDYLLIKKLDRKPVPTDRIPFTKRYAYSCEAEYRIIAELDEDLMIYQVDIPLNIIKKITLSSKLPKSTFENLESLLTTLIDKENIVINQSSLYKNDEWIENFKNRSTSKGA